MRKNWSLYMSFCIGLLLVMSPLCAQMPAGSAHIRGSVTDENGRPLANAKIIYVRIPRYVRTVSARGILKSAKAPGETDLSASLPVDTAGDFDIANLPAGDYVLCVQAPGGYLDPCRWGLPTSLAGISTGQARQAPPIRLKKGTVLSVRVNDPQSLLPRRETAIAGSGLVVGVRPPSGAFYSAELQSVDNTGRTFEIAVPYDTPLSLWVFSRLVKLADEKGNPVGTTGSAIPIRVPPGTSPSVTFNVVGRL